MDLKWGHHPQDRIYRIWNSQTLDAPKIRSSFSLYVPGWFTRTFQEIKSVEEEDFRDSGSKQFNTHAMKKKYPPPHSILSIEQGSSLRSPPPPPATPLTLASCSLQSQEAVYALSLPSAVGGQVENGETCACTKEMRRKWGERASKLRQSPDRFPTDRLWPSDSREKIKQKCVSIPALRDSLFYRFTGDIPFLLPVEAPVKKATG